MKKILIIDISGKVDNYDKALYNALLSKSQNGGTKVQLLIPGKGLLRIIPRKISQTEFILKRLAKVIEVMVNYVYVCSRLLVQSIDVVHLQWLPFLEVTGIEKHILQVFRKISPKTKFVLTIHNIYPHGANKYSEKQRIRYNKRFTLACEQFDILIVHTESSRREIVEEFGIKESRIKVVPHGVFVPHQFVSSIRSKTHDRITILQFGLQSYYKGTDIFVKAVNELSETYRNRIEARVVGGISDSYFEELKKIDKGNFNWKPYFLPDKELYEEICNCDILVLPYREISQSGVLLLSVFFEKLIICSNLPSFVETLHGDCDDSLDNELFFESENVPSLCDLIKKYVDGQIHEHSIRKRISYLKELYSWENSAIKTLTIYNSLYSRS